MTTGPARVTPAVGRAVIVFVGVVVCAGAWVIGAAFAEIGRTPVSGYAVLFAALTVLAGRFTIKVPGYPATVSVSELFVFGSILLFGPAAAILTVALDGLSVSLTHTTRRLHRTLFNIAEPAVSVWAAGSVAFLLLPAGPLFANPVTAEAVLLPTAAMAATYFVFNSLLTAAALGLESGQSIAGVWRQHATYLGLNYLAGASLAGFAVVNMESLSLAMFGLGLPVLALSYAAYKAASGRLVEAEAHGRHTAKLYSSTVEMLAIAVDAKDRVTHGHIRRVQRHSMAVAAALGVTGEVDQRAIEAASLLHDLGKIAIPDHLLNKPGGLSPAEYERIKTHASIGATILNGVDFPYPVAPIVKHHHENWDGTGYPDRLAGTAIPLGARIIAVVDCFDAVTSTRPYRRGMTEAEGRALLLERRGRMYDPAVVDAFIALLPELRRADREWHAQALANPAIPGFEYEPPTASAPGESAAGVVELLAASGDGIVAAVRDAVPGAEVCLMAVDGDTGRLVAAAGTPAILHVAQAADLRFGEGLAGWVAANRQTIVNSDSALDFGNAASGLGLGRCLCIPVFGFGTVAAVAGIYATGDEAFTSHHVRVLGSVVQDRALSPTGAGRHGRPSPARRGPSRVPAVA